MTREHPFRFAALRRLFALMRKEGLQILRDPSAVAVGIVMPVVLILLFGYGLSLDVRDVPLALVVDDDSAIANDLAAAFRLTPAFAASDVASMEVAEKMMRVHAVSGILLVPAGFARDLSQRRAEVQVLVNGVDANTARIVEGFASGVLGTWAAKQASRGATATTPAVLVKSRLWFNEANDSHYFLVPGLLVLVITLIGALLTTLVMAREWERGTFEALFATPVRAVEILLGKIVPYFAMGLVGLLLCVIASQVLFHVPLRGSLTVLLGTSMLYLLTALGVGLVVSSATKNQFIASQATVALTFLPGLLLSGFLFDLRSTPVAVQVIASLFPARYYVALLQTLFLAGDEWSIVIPNTLILALFAVLLMWLAARSTRKRLS